MPLRPAITSAIASGALLVAACSGGERAASRPMAPSILLVVIDTLRADAVSAYGAVAGTTPHLDALAAEGLRYENAFAPAPWTLPSHATLFTGLGADRHGVGLDGRMALPAGIETLADRLSTAGYETLGLSENPIVSHHFGLTRGFARFSSALIEDTIAAGQGFATDGFDLLAQLADWAGARTSDDPFFLFVNLYGVHDPYALQPGENPYLPEGVARAEAERVLATSGRLLAQCERLPGARDLAILRGLYLGEVRAADAQLGAILGLARAAAGDRGLVTVVTSDHGEHLGEHGLLGHEFSLRDVLLRIPLVVHGLDDAEPASIAAPVGLADLMPSILEWAWQEAEGTPLPTRARAAAPPRDLLAAWSDAPPVTPASVRPVIEYDNRLINQKRVGCAGSQRVFGDLVAVTRFPHRLLWFEKGPPELYDLAGDPGEERDLAASHPDLAAPLLAEAGSFRERANGLPAGAGSEIRPEALEALRALGYAE